MRLTKNRKVILNLLEKQKRPLSAQLIYDLLPEKTMDLSTIYRGLEKLYEHNILAKSTLNQTAYYYLNKKDHFHYMLCLGCQKMIKLDCYLELFVAELEKTDNLKIVSHDLTFYGYCSNCQ